MSTRVLQDLQEASTLSRVVARNFDVAVAMEGCGYRKEADYHVQIAHAALHSLADHLGYRLEKFAPVKEVA